MPAAALCGLAAITTRVVRTLDRSRTAGLLMLCFTGALFVTFGVRVSSHARDAATIFVNTAVRE